MGLKFKLNLSQNLRYLIGNCNESERLKWIIEKNRRALQEIKKKRTRRAVLSLKDGRNKTRWKRGNIAQAVQSGSV